ncbi:hypothetical protein T492DRAFT_837088 [Pavlovales sp. CCMP2436]|nr:hypothetical protein T492DRAFT_837088 [Pavlovales sp. CCMP2436]
MLVSPATSSRRQGGTQVAEEEGTGGKEAKGWRGAGGWGIARPTKASLPDSHSGSFSRPNGLSLPESGVSLDSSFSRPRAVARGSATGSTLLLAQFFESCKVASPVPSPVPSPHKAGGQEASGHVGSGQGGKPPIGPSASGQVTTGAGAAAPVVESALGEMPSLETASLETLSLKTLSLETPSLETPSLKTHSLETPRAPATDEMPPPPAPDVPPGLGKSALLKAKEPSRLFVRRTTAAPGPGGWGVAAAAARAIHAQGNGGMNEAATIAHASLPIAPSSNPPPSVPPIHSPVPSNALPPKPPSSIPPLPNPPLPTPSPSKSAPRALFLSPPATSKNALGSSVTADTGATDAGAADTGAASLSSSAQRSGPLSNGGPLLNEPPLFIGGPLLKGGLLSNGGTARLLGAHFPGGRHRSDEQGSDTWSDTRSDTRSNTHRRADPSAAIGPPLSLVQGRYRQEVAETVLALSGCGNKYK